MKRNWDTIRDILSKLEAAPDSWGSMQHADFEFENSDELSYHMELLLDAGLVEGKMVKTIGAGPYGFIANRLTWEGHEFLDAIRSDTVWQQTQESFEEAGTTMTFELVKMAALRISHRLLDLSLGG